MMVQDVREEDMAGIEAANLRTLSPALRAEYLRRGWWDDRTLGYTLLDWLSRHPQFEYGFYSPRGQEVTTFGAVRDQSLRLMEGLRRRGIGAGDVVCVYVPNSLPGALAFHAVPSLGAVLVPVAPFYGAKELRFILQRSKARILITAEAPAGGRLDTIAAMRRDLPDLEDVYVIGDAIPSGMRDYRELLGEAAMAALPKVDPDSVAAIAFTSGTTSDPKGVVHTHRSLLCETWLHMDATPTQKRPLLVGGPIAHVTGMLVGIFLQPCRHKPVHVMDGWDVPTVLRLMREHDWTAGAGAPVFMNAILHHPQTRDEDTARLENFAMGGSPVLESFIRLAESKGSFIVRCYGSTEHPTVTMGRLDDPDEKRRNTDGRVLEGAEIRVVDEEGHDLPAGEAGELISRGPDLMAGYIDPAMNAEHFTPDGWFRTGDIGTIDAEGYFTVTDRKKDIIIRNSVKISAMEVENCLLQLPGVTEVAVIGIPDARTGERTHAVVKLREGATPPTLDQMQSHLERVGLAKQKWPEGIEPIAEFPRTASGKIRKVDLRKQYAKG
jgi:acyl-CoA synthetase (AMP-forming)/AMP-acid ligase II